MKSNPTDPKEVRKLGGIGLIFFLVLLNVALWRVKPVMVVIFGILAFMMLLFAALPKPMAPVYRGWLAVGHGIGKGVNTVMLTLAFYIAITPFGILKRLFQMGGPSLVVKPDPEAETYWVRREVPAQERKQFTRRY